MVVDWQKALLGHEALISEAVRVLEETSLRIVLIVDGEKKLVGTVTDGDIRRGLMRNAGMTDPVTSIMNERPITASVTQSGESILALMRQWDVLQVPVVDIDRRVVQVELLQKLTSREILKNPVLLMAGGVGSRLYPLTEDTPKPMLKVGGKPILESIIEQLIGSGFINLYISICYKGEIVRDYFGNGSEWGANIQYLEESEPLGTAGALGLLPDDDNDSPILMVNGDILTRVDFRRLLDFHKEQGGHLTMCVREYDFQVPYGVVEVSGQQVTSLKEKPIQKFFVNAGIYTVDKNLINNYRKSTAIDMPDLINDQLEQSNLVNVFPIHEYWLDVGLMEQYKQAQIDVSRLPGDQ